jgi:alpha-glucosidase
MGWRKANCIIIVFILIAAINTVASNDARTVKISFDFLPKGKKYIAKIYSDDPSVNTKTKVNVAERKVDASVVLGVTLAASGGQAIWIRQE